MTFPTLNYFANRFRADRPHMSSYQCRTVDNKSIIFIFISEIPNHTLPVNSDLKHNLIESRPGFQLDTLAVSSI